MSTLANWTEASNATNETGDTTGGIRIDPEGDKFIQMNSWWDNAKWTKITNDTGQTIADDSIRTKS